MKKSSWQKIILYVVACILSGLAASYLYFVHWDEPRYWDGTNHRSQKRFVAMVTAMSERIDFSRLTKKEFSDMFWYQDTDENKRKLALPYNTALVLQKDGEEFARAGNEFGPAADFAKVGCGQNCSLVVRTWEHENSTIKYGRWLGSIGKDWFTSDWNYLTALFAFFAACSGLVSLLIEFVIKWLSKRHAIEKQKMASEASRSIEQIRAEMESMSGTHKSELEKRAYDLACELDAKSQEKIAELSGHVLSLETKLSEAQSTGHQSETVDSKPLEIGDLENFGRCSFSRKAIKGYERIRDNNNSSKQNMADILWVLLNMEKEIPFQDWNVRWERRESQKDIKQLEFVPNKRTRIFAHLEGRNWVIDNITDEFIKSEH